MKKQEIRKMEGQHAAAYARIPSEAAEFEEWESEQVWSEDEGTGPEEAIEQTTTTGEGAKELASRNESLGFARRTLQNLDHIEQARKEGDHDVHVITQRTVSLLGLIVFPWLQGFDESIKSKGLKTLEEKGWPSWSFLQGESKTLGDLLRHLRNAIAHKRLRFSSDSRDPEEVRIEFADAKSDEATPYWRAEIGADALLSFCRRFVALVEDTIG